LITMTTRKGTHRSRWSGSSPRPIGCCPRATTSRTSAGNCRFRTNYRWRNQFGGLKADDAKRLKDLERENATLKRLLADAELEKAALKEIASGNF
jgi:hypothetical protein